MSRYRSSGTGAASRPRTRNGHRGNGQTASPELDNDLIREERAIALREAMRELAPQGRELLRLLMVDPPMSYDQISVLMGIPKGSIGPTRARILDKLRTHRALQDLASPC